MIILVAVNFLPATRTLDLLNDEVGRPLKPDAEIGFEYSDCSVDDSRLVVLNAMDARAHGAVIETRQEIDCCRAYRFLLASDD